MFGKREYNLDEIRAELIDIQYRMENGDSNVYSRLEVCSHKVSQVSMLLVSNSVSEVDKYRIKEIIDLFWLLMERPLQPLRSIFGSSTVGEDDQEDYEDQDDEDDQEDYEDQDDEDDQEDYEDQDDEDDKGRMRMTMQTASVICPNCQNIVNVNVYAGWYIYNVSIGPNESDLLYSRENDYTCSRCGKQIFVELAKD